MVSCQDLMFPQEQEDQSHNLGKCPTSAQSRRMREYRSEIDRDNWEVDYEIAVLTRNRKRLQREAAK